MCRIRRRVGWVICIPWLVLMALFWLFSIFMVSFKYGSSGKLGVELGNKMDGRMYVLPFFFLLVLLFLLEVCSWTEILISLSYS